MLEPVKEITNPLKRDNNVHQTLYTVRRKRYRIFVIYFLLSDESCFNPRVIEKGQRED